MRKQVARTSGAHVHVHVLLEEPPALSPFVQSDTSPRRRPQAVAPSSSAFLWPLREHAHFLHFFLPRPAVSSRNNFIP